MRRTYNRWPAESIEKALSLKGRVSKRTAERITGIPASTIYLWWSGRSDPWRGPGLAAGHRFTRRTHCKRGHALTPANRRQIGGTDRYQCARCKRNADRASGYRRRAVFHPQWNPDPELAPLHTLWLPAAEVAAFILSRMPKEDVPVQLGRESGSRQRWNSILSGRQPWLRLDAADDMFTKLGLVLSEMDVEPHYSTRPPKELP